MLIEYNHSKNERKNEKKWAVRIEIGRDWEKKRVPQNTNCEMSNKFAWAKHARNLYWPKRTKSRTENGEINLVGVSAQANFFPRNYARQNRISCLFAWFFFSKKVPFIPMSPSLLLFPFVFRPFVSPSQHISVTIKITKVLIQIKTHKKVTET